ncbi:CPBP family glutamic-type intramembrane protease [Bacillus toyonensis]|uniref:CAAX prenyl protease 2/Lysostaphin resistance protein A-like domain-containing protein n=1 Tax=Bacillus toyonensis TaxID=155322 RepID=A0AB73QZF8_9BACI|nr:CPBP family glutamic-type intramembrane protease [Bacillus toyonensis]PEI87966.1 hypothetical protein CN678_06580 [Bacillus toyonensis]PEL51602.1 hypothetical protein CN638_13065 [Bacillus toyonensis]
MYSKINKFMLALPTISFVLLILLGVLAISIVETVIFQVFLFWVLSWFPFIKNRDYLIILIASMIFGLNHPNDITYIGGTAIINFLYNYAYWVYQKKNDKYQVTPSAFGVIF